MRNGLVAPYIIVHQHAPEEDVVAIIRILDGRRRITRRMLGPETTFRAPR